MVSLSSEEFCGQMQKNLTEKFLASSSENPRLSWLSPWEVFPPHPLDTSSMQSFLVSASTPHVPDQLWASG